MPTDREALYGVRRPKSEVSKKDLTSSTTLAFATHLSSLISKSSKSSPSPSSNDDPLASSTSRGRTRPSRTKKDLFSVHNKGAQKRAAADLSADASRDGVFQTHKKEADIGAVDDAALHRSKRKMLEKAKLYADLKKGEYLADAGSSSDEEYGGRDTSNSKSDKHSAARRAEKHSLVDFDRKWAAEEDKKRESHDNEDEDEDNGNKSDNASLVDYEDEFGRTRQGTRAEAAEAQRARESDQQAQLEDNDQNSFGTKHGLPSRVPQSALPSRPSNLIYGSAIQAAAFNPDASIAEKMSHLSKRRDRTPTPPPETHYNADGEIRTRGTGFYAFSKDEEVRRGEMGDLLQARDETMREREEASTRKQARERAKMERMRKIEELRGKRRAEQFLNGLGGPLDITGGKSAGAAASKDNDGNDKD